MIPASAAVFSCQNRRHATRATRVLMVLQNCPYFHDARVPKEAAALKGAGYRVLVLAPRERKTSWHCIVEEVDIYQYPTWPNNGGTLGYLAEFFYSSVTIAVLSFWLLLRRGFDVIHISNPPDCLVPILSVYKIIGKKILYDQHDLSPELYAAKFKNPNQLLCNALHWLEQCSYRLADHVIVTNESYKEISRCRGRVSEQKVTVVRNGPVLRRLTVAGVDSIVRSKASNIIAFAGVTGTQDGLDDLCRALYHLRYTIGCEGFYCIVLGDGDALANTKRLARDLDLESKIWFSGWISDPDEYARYLFTADICVSPEPLNDYNDRSTFMKIMEYMAMAKPIVAFDLCETKRSAQGSALYVKPGDILGFAEAIFALIEAPARRRSMGEAGRRRAQNELAWQYSVQNLLKAYAAVTNGRSEHSGTKGGLNTLGANVS